MSQRFDHEKLRVYQQSLKCLTWVQETLDQIPKNIAVYTHLDRASTSILLNIAEGNGKFTEKDRCRFFDIARGSALECAACLDVLVAKGILSRTDIQEGKDTLSAIVSMLIGLIRSNSSQRVYEETGRYEADGG